MRLASHLNKKIFDEDVEQVPNRNGYGEGLKELGENNKQVVALCGDLTESTRTHLFRDAFPERFVQCGIAEQSMASVASGMAAMGKIPFIASYAMFSPGRSWEQVRTTIAYNNANVKIIGAHSGISVGPDGATHQAIEDMAIMRVIPNMTVVAPCDVYEARRVVLYAGEHKGPMYIRLARDETPVITTPESPFVFGKGEIYVAPDEGVEKKVAIISCGNILHHALLAGKSLNESGVGTAVISMPTVKPIDTELLDVLSNEYQILVTVEEHQIAGGLGSVVTEYLSGTNPKKVVRIGIDDRFGQSGTFAELCVHYKLDSNSIVERVKGSL